MTPASRTRVASLLPEEAAEPLHIFRVIYDSRDGTMRDRDGNIVEDDEPGAITLDSRL
jgi:hypothetical protein